MGGGGGGGSRNIGDLSRATDEVKKALSQQRRNVFVSFAYEDVDEVNLLRGQSKNDLLDIAFNDWSVSEPYDSKNAEYIQRQITERIKQSSLTVVFLSSATASSRWVEWEVRQTKALGKDVLAVHSGSKPPSGIPGWIAELGVKVVPWKNLASELKPK
jgi:hypothetical protein